MLYIKSKIIIIILCLFSILANAQNNDTISIVCPDTVYAGKSFAIEIPVKIPDGVERAAYKQIVPFVFSAKDQSVANELGYYYSANGQIIKYSWMGKPKKTDFILKHEISIGDGIKGLYLIEGRFAILLNGKKENVYVIPKKLVVL